MSDVTKPSSTCIIAGCDLTGLWQVEGQAAAVERGELVAVSGLICQHHYQVILQDTPLSYHLGGSSRAGEPRG